MVKKIASRLAESGPPWRSGVGADDASFSFPRGLRFTTLIIDLAIVCADLGSVTLGHDRPLFPQNGLEFGALITVLLLAMVIFIRQGLYRAIIRHMGPQAVWDLVGAVTGVALLLAGLSYFAKLDVAPSAPGIFWLLLFFGMGGVRLLARAVHQTSSARGSRRVVIYGAGESGRQLLHALNHGAGYDVVAFVDDDPSLYNAVINGRPVFSSALLESLVHDQGISQVLLAVPSASPDRRREIINSLVGIPVHVRTVPKISSW